jgi:hypothetical protein
VKNVTTPPNLVFEHREGAGERRGSWSWTTPDLWPNTALDVQRGPKVWGVSALRTGPCLSTGRKAAGRKAASGPPILLYWCQVTREGRRGSEGRGGALLLADPMKSVQSFAVLCCAMLCYARQSNIDQKHGKFDDKVRPVSH